MDNPAAWHPDPTGRHEHRWWDGERWTEHVADAGQASVDPIEGGDATGGGADHLGDDGASADTAAGSGWASGSAAGSADEPGSSTPQGTSWEQPEPGGAETSGSHDAANGGGSAGGWGQPGGQQQDGGWGQPGGSAAGGTGQWGQQGATPGGHTGWDQPGSQQSWQQQPGQQGWQQQPQQWPQATPTGEAPKSGTAGLAIFALIMGILSLVFFWMPVLGGLGALVAIIFGFVGRSSAKKRGVGGAGMAIAGVVTGIIALLLNIFITLVIFGALGDMNFFGIMSDYAECMEQYDDEEFCEQQLEDSIFDWME